MKSFTLLLGLVFSFSVCTATNYFEGEELFVSAISGLKIRNQPKIKSQSISVMPYQSEVLILNVFEFSQKEIIENREGNWIYIEFENKKGYVFDGFLSKFKVSSRKSPDDRIASEVIKYFESNYRKITERDTIWSSGNNQKLLRLENEINIYSNTQGGCFSTKIEIGNYRLSEGLNLIESLIYDSNLREVFNRMLEIKYDENGKIVKYTGGLESKREIEIEIIGGCLILFVSGCC